MRVFLHNTKLSSPQKKEERERERETGGGGETAHALELPFRHIITGPTVNRFEARQRRVSNNYISSTQLERETDTLCRAYREQNAVRGICQITKHGAEMRANLLLFVHN